MNGTADHLSNSGKGVVESHGRLRVDRRKRRLFLSLFSGTVRPDSRHPSGLQHSFHQQLYRRFPLPDHTGGGARQISQTQTDPIRQPFLPLPFSLPEEHHLQRRNGTGAAQCAPCGRQLHPIPLLRRLAVLDTDRIGGGEMSSILPNPSTTTGYMTATPPQNRSSRDASTSKRSASSKKPSDS